MGAKEAGSRSSSSLRGFEVRWLSAGGPFNATLAALSLFSLKQTDASLMLPRVRQLERARPHKRGIVLSHHELSGPKPAPRLDTELLVIEKQPNSARLPPCPL